MKKNGFAICMMGVFLHSTLVPFCFSMETYIDDKGMDEEIFLTSAIPNTTSWTWGNLFSTTTSIVTSAYSAYNSKSAPNSSPPTPTDPESSDIPINRSPSPDSLFLNDSGLYEETVGHAPFLKNDMCIFEKNKENTHFLLGHHENFTENELSFLIKKGYKSLKKISKGKEISHSLDVFQQNAERFKPNHWLKNGVFGGLGVTYFFEHKNLLNLQAKMETLISIVWALSDYSYKKSQGFTRGSFSIIDPERKLHSFLESYTLDAGESVDATKLTNLSTISHSLLKAFGTNNRAYKRLSSHYPKKEGLFKGEHHFGLEMRFEKSSYAVHVLPHFMSHILWSLVSNGKNEKIFLKFEPYGMGDYKALAAHTLEFLAAVQQSHMMRREKDIPEEISKKAIIFFKDAWDAHLLYNKFTPFFKEVMVECRMKSSHFIEWLKKSDYIDIATLWSWCTSNIVQQDEKLKKSADDLKETILSTYDIDSEEMMAYRTGNEVVIDLQVFKDWETSGKSLLNEDSEDDLLTERNSNSEDELD